MKTLFRDLHFLWRAESIVADIQLRHFTTRTEIRAFAALGAIFAFFMLNLAGFFALQPSWGRVWAAIAMSGADLTVAALLLALSGAAKPGRDLELAREVRQMAFDSMETHARNAGEDVCGIRTTMAALKHNPLDTVLPAIVIPLTRALLKSLRKPDRTPVPAPTTAP